MQIALTEIDPNAPLIAVQLGLQVFCLVKLIRSKKRKYLNKWIWAFFIILFNFITCILYLVLESGQNDRD